MCGLTHTLSTNCANSFQQRQHIQKKIHIFIFALCFLAAPRKKKRQPFFRKYSERTINGILLCAKCLLVNFCDILLIIKYLMSSRVIFRPLIQLCVCVVWVCLFVWVSEWVWWTCFVCCFFVYLPVKILHMFI